MKRTSLFAISLLGLLVSPSCLATLTIDPKDNIKTTSIVLAQKTLLSNDAAINGNEIEILKTNDIGVVHLYYDNFNIERSGLELNNSKSKAKLIVNEVVSHQKSQLNGRLSVIGEKAAVVIANPNGIDCNDCSFAGTDSVKLITGRSKDKYSDTFKVTDSAINFAFNNNRILKNNPIIIVDQKDKGESSINIISNKILIEKGYLKATNIQFNIDLSEISLNYINMKDREELNKDIKRDSKLNIFKNAGVVTRKLELIINNGNVYKQGIINANNFGKQINLHENIDKSILLNLKNKIEKSKSTVSDKKEFFMAKTMRRANFDFNTANTYSKYNPNDINFSFIPF